MTTIKQDYVIAQNMSKGSKKILIYAYFLTSIAKPFETCIFKTIDLMSLQILQTRKNVEIQDESLLRGKDISRSFTIFSCCECIFRE